MNKAAMINKMNVRKKPIFFLFGIDIFCNFAALKY